MARGPELDPQTRSRICELKSIGWSYNQIQKRFPHIALSTIKSTVLREKERVNCVSKPRSGAPRKLSETQRDRICELVMQDPDVKYNDLLAAVDNVVTKKSIRRLVQEMRSKARSSKKVAPEKVPEKAHAS